MGLALGRLLGISFELVRGCFPDQRRQRYGDAEYDWEHRVDTTSATVSWRSRLMGLLNSPYQPIPEDQFREMMRALNIDFSRFTFIDIGSGKGRALMLASEYGFRRIIGVELLPELDRIARQNLTRLRERGKNLPVELVCGDAIDFAFPAEPTVVFLFNPLPTSSLARMLQNIKGNLQKRPHPLYLAYANAVLEHTIVESQLFSKLAGTREFSLFYNSGFSKSGLPGFESSVGRL
ncbi:MAG TPA: class I SAM-dependent methyltransferase [Terriglobales bacterium]|nr:class I SAM-dependent methyltransferase [Terriglobales bacterium]